MPFLYFQVKKNLKKKPRLMQRYEAVSTTRKKEGSYGIVCEFLDTIRNKHVAIKTFKQSNREDFKNDIFSPSVVREITCLKQLQGHSCIVSLIDVLVVKDNVHLVLELMDASLQDVIRKRVDIYEDMFESFKQDIASGVHYCHQHNIIHRDIKPGNVLVTPYKAKLADFGLATQMTLGRRHAQRSYTPTVVTIFYRAPELLQEYEYYTQAIDIWAMACVYFEMDHKTILFEGHISDEEIQLQCVNKTSLASINTLYQDMLNTDSTKRPSALEILMLL